MSEEVRFGLVGFGLFGAHHAAAISNCRGASLAAIAVKSPASQAAARRAFPSTEVYRHYQQLLERPDIDVVCVVVPNLLHYEVAKAVLESNKHLLLEKPMALGVSECDELNALARRKGRVLAIGHELRLSSLWGEAKRLIDRGVIGKPLYALVELSRFPYRQGAEGWRYDIQRVGSWILEEPIHFFDLARWYLETCGDPVSVYARASARRSDHPELLDNFSAIVNFDGGAHAVVAQTLAAFGHHQTVKVTGTDGAIWAWWSAADARADKPVFGLRYGLGDEVHEIEFQKPTGELLELADEIAAVAECVRSGGPPPCSGEDGRWSTLLCLAAQQSIETGQIVALQQFAARR